MRASIASAGDGQPAEDHESLVAAAAQFRIRNLSVSNIHGKTIIRGRAQYQLDREMFFDAVKQFDGWERDVVVDVAVERHDIRGYHTVQPGETLASIAELHFGDASRERRIFEANRDRMNDPDQIFPGQQLLIPR